MLDETKIRYYIMAGWLIAFFTMWLVFSKILPREEFHRELETIKTSIQAENWSDAEIHMTYFEEMVENKKLIINSNNSTEAHSNFEVLIGQLKIAILTKENDALEYLEGLKRITTDLTKAFAGP